MYRPTYVSIIFSLSFFSLFVFTNLTLFISQFSYSFSHLFLIFIREDQFFDHLTMFLFLCGFLLSITFIILGSWYKAPSILQYIFMLVLSVIFLYLFVLKIAHVPKTEDIMDMFAIEGSIYHRAFFELLDDYLPRILIIGGIYIFFVYIPLLFDIFSLRPHHNSKIAIILCNMCPSINVIIFMFFGLSLQPYYFRDNLYAYFDIFAFFVGFILLIFVAIKHKELFSFYEYMNLALLILGVIICFICTSVLSISDNYFNARYAFLVFAFVSWCAEWMYRDIVKPIKE